MSEEMLRLFKFNIFWNCNDPLHYYILYVGSNVINTENNTAMCFENRFMFFVVVFLNI